MLRATLFVGATQVHRKEIDIGAELRVYQLQLVQGKAATFHKAWEKKLKPVSIKMCMAELKEIQCNLLG